MHIVNQPPPTIKVLSASVRSIPLKESHGLGEIPSLSITSSTLTGPKVTLLILHSGWISSAMKCVIESTNLFNFATSFGSPRNVNVHGTSKPPRARSSEKRLLPVMVQAIIPFLYKKHRTSSRYISQNMTNSCPSTHYCHSVQILSVALLSLTV